VDVREFLKDIVFGIEDGLITPLGVVLGVATSGAPNSIVILAGLAATFSNAVSMAAGDFLSTEYQLEAYRRVRAKQMAVQSASLMFIGTLSGILVVAPFALLKGNAATLASLFIAILGLFVTGALVTRITKRNWVRHGLQMVVIGIAAAGIGFLIGRFLGAPVG